jgi:hypothetical protein
MQPLPAQSTIMCSAEVESVDGRKIWVSARVTDPTGATVFADSRALFVKPREPVPFLAPGAGVTASTASGSESAAAAAAAR